MNYVYVLLLLGTVVALCVFLGRFSEKLKIPSLLLFIGLGMLFGENGIGISFDDYSLTGVICSVCLIFVIFYGGFGTNVKEARPVMAQSLLLSGVGTALTAGITGVVVYFIFNTFTSIGWIECMLIGSVLSSTDAASVFNILRTRKLGLKYNTSSLLEMESGSNDPVSYMLTVLFTTLLSAQNFGAGQVIWLIVRQIGIGAAFGAFLGFAAVFILRKLPFGAGQGGTIFVFAVAILSYALPQIPFLSGNGYLAAYIAGIIMGNARLDKKREIVKFFDSLTGVAQMLIFFLLGLLVTPVELPRVMLPALIVFAVITLIARPVAASGLLLPFRTKPNKLAVVSLAGLRGVASVVFAITATELAGGSLTFDLFNLVFCVSVLSILVQGTLLPPVSRAVGMIDNTSNVMRTFNDYQEESDIGFVRIRVGKDHAWYGKKLKDAVMPEGFLILLVIRNKRAFVPDGRTTVTDGDILVAAAPAFEKNDEFGMYDEYIGKNHEWAGKSLREIHLPKGNLVALLRRGGKSIVPRGGTVVREGDTLALIKTDDLLGGADDKTDPVKEDGAPDSLPWDGVTAAATPAEGADTQPADGGALSGNAENGEENTPSENVDKKDD